MKSLLYLLIIESYTQHSPMVPRESLTIMFQCAYAAAKETEQYEEVCVSSLSDLLLTASHLQKSYFNTINIFKGTFVLITVILKFLLNITMTPFECMLRDSF